MYKQLSTFTKKLKDQGFEKLANELTNLFDYKSKRDQQKQRNKEVIEQIQREQKLQDITKEHSPKDKADLAWGKPELTYPSLDQTPNSRRFDVHIQYASVDEEGRPYFEDDDALTETVTVTKDELENLKREEELNYLRILDIQVNYPSTY